MNSNSAEFSPGLALINDYCSSEDDSSDDHESKLTKIPTEVKSRLPLPTSLFNRSEECGEDPSVHDGRIRSFPHQRGNWATYIFIPYPVTESYQSFVDIVIANSDPALGLRPIQDPHISLTHTVVLLHHWIKSFTETVEQRLNYTVSFDITFDSLSVYTNKEKTRTFIGLDVACGSQELSSIVNILNGCLKEFNLETFYEVPSFHVSFAWCLGDQKDIVERTLPYLQNYFQQFVIDHSELRHLHVSYCCCKTGNKLFNFKLKSL